MTARTLTPGRHPFEVAAFLAFLISGIAGAFGARSPSIVEAYPEPYVLVFYIIVSFWSAVGLIGLGLRDQEDRLRIERIACYGVGFCVMAYAAAAFGAVGLAGTTAALGVGWIAAACGWRIWQIHQDLKLIRQYLAETRAAREEAAE